MADKPKVESPKVIAMAEGRVDLATVAGTGRDGLITPNDVLRAYIADKTGLPPDTPGAELAAAMVAVINVRKRELAAAEARTAHARERAQMTAASPSVLASRVASKGPAFALNPIAVSAAKALATANVTPTRPAPTLFASGDLPSFTASGIPVDRLLDVPWQARHALASASTQAEAYAIHSRCTQGAAGLTGEQIADDYGLHPGNVEYERRVRDWAKTEAEALIDEDAWFARLEGPGARTGNPA